MRIDTTNAISKALAAANKLTIPEANTPAMHPKATKHRPALLAAQFIIVCSFRKVDKHMFRAYNTISVTAQRTIIRKGSPYIEKKAILLPSHVTALSGTPIEQGLNKILIFVSLALISLQNRKEVSNYCLCLDFLSTVQNAKQQCRDILEKESLNKSEFKTYSSCKVKRFTSNSVKDLFTNLSKDYFLSIAAEDAAKAANTLPPPKEVRAKILIESYKPIVQALAEIYVSIIYFNLDSELELKVLGKQDVKTTSRDKL
ncbi:hypothetical protein HBH46_117670 [Parastagonospora nodorum]|nr:hypothetical protein HBH46_117670 [Parastagonospora nodorum]